MSTERLKCANDHVKSSFMAKGEDVTLDICESLIAGLGTVYCPTRTNYTYEVVTGIIYRL